VLQVKGVDEQFREFFRPRILPNRVVFVQPIHEIMLERGVITLNQIPINDLLPEFI
jgi:hypothetical protein